MAAIQKSVVICDNYDIITISSELRIGYYSCARAVLAVQHERMMS